MTRLFQKIFIFSAIFHSCAWNDNSLSFLHILSLWLCLMSFHRFYFPSLFCRATSQWTLGWLAGAKRNLILRYAEFAQKRAFFCDEQIVIISLNMLTAGQSYCQLFERKISSSGAKWLEAKALVFKALAFVLRCKKSCYVVLQKFEQEQ